jgi:hypothetical protein
VSHALLNVMANLAPSSHDVPVLMNLIPKNTTNAKSIFFLATLMFPFVIASRPGATLPQRFNEIKTPQRFNEIKTIVFVESQ